MLRETFDIRDFGGAPLQLSHISEENGKNAGGHADGLGIAIRWQQGSIQEAGRNGAFLEDLMVIAREQLHYFQRSPFPCYENAQAIVFLNQAIDAMRARRKDRQDRGVEGLEKP